MRKITITINTENAAFCPSTDVPCHDSNQPGLELARILRDLAEALVSGSRPHILYDYIGNSVGEIGYT